MYELDSTYDCSDKLKALEKSMEGGKKIPIGILFEQSSESYEDKRPALFDGVPVIDKVIHQNEIVALMEAFI